MRFLGEITIVLVSVLGVCASLLLLAWWLLWNVFVWLPGLFMGG